MKKKIEKRNLLIIFFSFLSLILSLVIVFFGGAASSETVADDVAKYTANVVKNDTETGTYLGTIIEPNDNNSNLPDAVTEFYALYGVFRQEKATFGSLFNANKSVDVFFSETESANLSIFCLGPNGTNTYKQHYKHYIYPFEMLFEDKSYYEVSKYIAYLSQSQADGILENRGVKKIDNEYSLSQYKMLLGTKTILMFNKQPFEYVIGNVFIQNNYYYDCFKETFGDFFLTSYFAPNVVSKQHVYFLTSYIYQNKFFMYYLNKKYDSSFKMSFSSLNCKNDIDTKRILSFRSTVKSEFEIIFILSCLFAALLAVIGYCLFYKIQQNKNLKIYFIHIMMLFIPFLIFKLFYTLSQNIYFFSTISTVVNAIFIIVGWATYSFIFFKKKKNKPIIDDLKLIGEKKYEVNI